MQLHCLGTAGYHPAESRHTSCYFLPESGIVLDAGTGMFRLAALIQTPTLDILLSHAHLDHVVGLSFLLDTMQQRPVKRVRVWGERIKLEAIQTHLLSEHLFPAEIPVQWCPIDDADSFELSDLRSKGPVVSWRPQIHPGGSVAYRVDWSGSHAVSMVFATDTTGATDSETLTWMRGVDLLLHECNFTDDERSWAEKTGHCWPSRVAEVASATSPKQLVLTHINPIAELDKESLIAIFGKPVRVAQDREVIEF